MPSLKTTAAPWSNWHAKGWRTARARSASAAITAAIAPPYVIRIRMQTRYEIIVHNTQGASEVFQASSRAAINRWLANWHDPEKLTARVILDGHEVARKRVGRKRL